MHMHMHKTNAIWRRKHTIYSCDVTLISLRVASLCRANHAWITHRSILSAAHVHVTCLGVCTRPAPLGPLTTMVSSFGDEANEYEDFPPTQLSEKGDVFASLAEGHNEYHEAAFGQ